jgi:hypothetical protein
MRLRARRWSAAASIALGGLWPGRASAEGPTVVVVAAAPTPFSARVRAEIEAMGFAIERAAVLTQEDEPRAVAAARIIEGPVRRVELWIADASTGRLALRAFVMPSPDDDEATQTVRASEQLRAFFQPLRESVPPPARPVPAPAPLASPLPPPPLFQAPPRAGAPDRAVTPPPVAEPASTPPPRPRFVVGADLAVPFQSGGPGFDVGLRGAWMATHVVGVGAFVMLPVAGSTVKAAEGSASVSAPLFGADLSVGAAVASRLRLSASAGLAVAWVRTSGFAAAPYTGQASNVTAALAIFGAEIAPRLTERTHLCFDGRLSAGVGVDL